MSDTLLEGWASEKLHALVVPRKGKKPDVLRRDAASGFVPYLDIHAIEQREVRQFADVASSRLACESDLLMVWDGARSGWVGTGASGAIGSTIMALTSSGVEPLYLRHFIAGQFAAINGNTRGTGIPHVDPEFLWNLEVPLPPLGEQRRIVAKLETLLGKVDACHRRLAKIPRLLKRFRQSVLAAACSGRLTADWRRTQQTQEPAGDLCHLNLRQPFELDAEFEPSSVPETWEYVPIGNLCGFQQGMQIAKSTRLKEAGPNRLPILRIGNYATRFSHDVDYVELSEESLIAEPDDIILTRTGETRGKVLTGFRGVFHNNTFRMNYERRRIERKYLIAWLDTATVQEFIRQQSGRSAQPDLTHKAFGPCPFPLPPLAEQCEIVRRVEQFFTLADQLEARFAKAQAYVDKLTPSLLAKAFRGELVPQDPNDEPGEVLLQRIREQEYAQNQNRQKTNSSRDRKPQRRRIHKSR